MSNIQETRTGDIRSVEETAKERERNRRFTPLRSYVSRARALAKPPRGELGAVPPHSGAAPAKLGTERPFAPGTARRKPFRLRAPGV